MIFSANDVIGATLGLVGKCKAVQIVIFASCQGVTKTLIDKYLNASAVTVGKNILASNQSLPTDVLRHELAHVKQYRLLGPAFLPTYGAAHLAAIVDSKIKGYPNVHAGNIFEIWADRMAGIPAENKY